VYDNAFQRVGKKCLIGTFFASPKVYLNNVKREREKTMTVTKTYTKQFTTKAEAKGFYNTLGRNKDIAGRTCGYNVPEHCYKVTYYFKKDVQW
jgi:hypothetical protein